MIRVVIPAYNEEKNIGICVRQVNSALKRYPHKIYVINDGSHDDTLRRLKTLSKRYPITILDHITNLGIATVFRTAMARMMIDAKTNDVVIIMEGDGTSDSALLVPMVKSIKAGNDIVIASRYIHGGRYLNFPFKRLFFSRSANFIFSFVFPSSKFRDYTIFYRAYRFDVLKKCYQHYGKKLIITKYFVANTELLVKLMKFTNRIGELPFIYDYGKKEGKSNLHIRRNVMEYFRFMAISKLELKKSR